MAHARALLPCRHLIVGSDLSAGAGAALRLATAWSGRLRVDLELVLALPRELEDSAEAPLEQALSEQLEIAVGDSAGARLVRGEGDAAGTLLSLAAARPGTWIVAGSEGSGASSLRHAGRQAAALCRSSPVPVLLAPPRWRPADRRRRAAAPGFSRVLVGLSGGPRDAALLDCALDLAAPPAGVLAVAHSIDLAWARDFPPEARALASKLGASARERFQRHLLALEEERVPLSAVGAELPLHLIQQGPPELDLAGLAASQSMDLLVVGAGPLTERLLPVADVPLLVLPGSLRGETQEPG